MSDIATMDRGVDFTLTVEDRPQRVVMVFNKKISCLGLPWQDVHKITDCIDECILAVGHEFTAPIRSQTYLREKSQIAMAHKDGVVILLVKWTDRLYYSSIAALTFVSEELKRAARLAAEAQLAGLLKGQVQRIAAPQGIQIPDRGI